MFEHKNFEVYDFHAIPLNRDLFLIEDTYLADFEAAVIRSFSPRGDYDPPGYISYVAARIVSGSTVELSWYANVSDRFHELTIYLPRDQFVACVGCANYEWKPHIFVKAAWVRALHLRRFAAFALIDAIGVKNALRNNALTRPLLLAVRDAIDILSATHPEVAFISVADSIVLKGSWSVGHFQSTVRYTYDPEAFLRIIQEVRDVYRTILGLDTYAVLTQGSNEYFDDSLLHVSSQGNHISLNSLGIPFAELFAIEAAAKASKQRSELYLDEKFLHSLNLKFGFDRDTLRRETYRANMTTGEPTYYCASVREIIDNLRGDTNGDKSSA